jgi:thymidine kinase
MAKLTYKYGVMGSSKTSSLIIQAYNFDEKNINFLCLKPGIDDRTGVNMIKSRVPGLQRECLTIYENSDIFEAIFSVIEELDSDNPIQYILIDEAQFLTSKQVEQIAKIVDDLNINIICYGLRSDFQTNLFEGSKRLFELADKIEEFETICECGETAIINARIDDAGNIIKEGQQIEIGYNYTSICRKCYEKN